MLALPRAERRAPRRRARPSRRRRAARRAPVAGWSPSASSFARRAHGGGYDAVAVARRARCRRRSRRPAGRRCRRAPRIASRLSPNRSTASSGMSAAQSGRSTALGLAPARTSASTSSADTAPNPTRLDIARLVARVSAVAGRSCSIFWRPELDRKRGSLRPQAPPPSANRPSRAIARTRAAARVRLALAVALDRLADELGRHAVERGDFLPAGAAARKTRARPAGRSSRPASVAARVRSW